MLARALHACAGLRDFDEMLELSMQGDNANVRDCCKPAPCLAWRGVACSAGRATMEGLAVLQVDMMVGDIYGGKDYRCTPLLPPQPPSHPIHLQPS
jgi:hypothetical protein